MKEILNNLLWIEEQLPDEALMNTAPKHGGMGYHMDMKLMLILVEQPHSTYEHKGVSYPFQLWNGVILPVEYKKQNAFFLKYGFLENHPANKDWLYIPAESENFEDDVKLVLREIHKKNPLLGIPVKTGTLSRAEAEAKAASLSSAKKKKTTVAPKQKINKKRENAFFLEIANKKK